jgi:hypothetical protein
MFHCALDACTRIAIHHEVIALREPTAIVRVLALKAAASRSDRAQIPVPLALEHGSPFAGGAGMEGLADTGQPE